MENRIFVSHIQRFSSDDGPGIRTTVFLKGCNLRCAWCHNPECIETTPSTLRRGETTETFGRYYDAEELLAEIAKDEKFYRTSGGGVTFSGGEPLLQTEALLPLLAMCRRKGYHICLDTAGLADFADFEKVLSFTDIFLYDLKAYKSTTHKRCTGTKNERILQNFIRLAECLWEQNQKEPEEAATKKAPHRKTIRVRIPVVPGWNLEEVVSIGGFLATLPHRDVVELVELLPYHAYGVGKYEGLGLACPTRDVTPPTEEVMIRLAETYQKLGLPAVVNG